ncbi:MAG TPA: GTP 3',8-cyclase MoaA [Pseudomonadales bacterium]
MLTDAFQRSISYVRLSVTDRCDFRCTYCMADRMTFLPRNEVLSLEEIERLARTLVPLGVSKIRITGGEPLVRQGLLSLLNNIGAIPGLKTLALTTNASRLAAQATSIRDAGVSRLNISLDSLQPDRFRALTRTGELAPVLAGIDAAQQAGFERIRINSVILKGQNDDEISNLARFALDRGLDIAFIEEMPLGEIARDRKADFVPSAHIRSHLAQHFDLLPSTDHTGGPARYFQVAGSSGRIGFISPHSENFCSQCNRVRITAQGRLLLCLGNEHSVDLKAILRDPAAAPDALGHAIRSAMANKPERHHFNLDEPAQILRFMNATGG